MDLHGNRRHEMITVDFKVNLYDSETKSFSQVTGLFHWPPQEVDGPLFEIVYPPEHVSGVLTEKGLIVGFRLVPVFLEVDEAVE